MTARILVTGAGGLAGSHLVQHLAAAHEVVAWARAEPSPELARLGRWQHVDMLDRTRVREAVRELKPSHVYHCAGVTHVARSVADSAAALAGNVLATHHLLDALRHAGSQARVLIPGSATVYAPSELPLDEDAPVAPATPYALSKLAQEQLALLVCRQDGIEVVLTRSFNHTGPRQAPDFMAPSIARQVALIERAAMEPVISVGNVEARRDLTDVRDVVRAYQALMDSGAVATPYNVASGVGHTVRAVVDALVARARVPIRVETDPARLRARDTPTVIGNPARLRTATGWQPEIAFDRMLDDLLDYWRDAVTR